MDDSEYIYLFFINFI